MAKSGGGGGRGGRGRSGGSGADQPAMKADGGPVAVNTEASPKQSGLQKAISNIKSKATNGKGGK